jgi:hypothetical protein
MSRAREIRCYEYVNRAYEPVRDALRAGAEAVFHAATKAASARAESLAVALRVTVAGIEIARDVEVRVIDVQEQPSQPKSPAMTRLRIEWDAAKAKRFFPLMKAELLVYPLTATETQVELLGHYEPPLGALGSAVDALVGHRIAEASVHRFTADVAAHLRQTLPAR